MKIYVPTKIASAEQAEALPLGTIAIDTEPNGAVIAVALKHARGWAPTNPYPEPIDPYENELMIGDTALVPVEAEEEWRTPPESLQDAINRMAARADEAARTGMLPRDRLAIQQQTRYVTPWTPASE